jgi:hypothetical protein
VEITYFVFTSDGNMVTLVEMSIYVYIIKRIYTYVGMYVILAFAYCLQTGNIFI